MRTISEIVGARLPDKPANTLWDITIAESKIKSVDSSKSRFVDRENNSVLHANGRLLAPSLCHAHVHLDKCFLLQHPKYKHLKIQRGDFAEAMELTSQAKAMFEEDDLMSRGRALISKSISAGVTVIRAFVECDEIVDTKCVDAAIKLQGEFSERCDVQICAFAQLALYSGDDVNQATRRRLLEQSLARPEVKTVGSTPYVEDSEENAEANILWTIKLAMQYQKHLDFHLDYNFDPNQRPLVWSVLNRLHELNWRSNASKTICLGHCTRLTLFAEEEWKLLRQSIAALPVNLVGLPTSDLFIMGRPQQQSSIFSARPRATLPIPQMIQQLDFNGTISMNNIGNAFTPQGSCDPLTLASFAVGVYQAATEDDIRILYECVSNRAKAAIGYEHAASSFDDAKNGNENKSLIVTGSAADLILYDTDDNLSANSISDVLLVVTHSRQVLFRGKLVADFEHVMQS